MLLSPEEGSSRTEPQVRYLDPPPTEQCVQSPYLRRYDWIPREQTIPMGASAVSFGSWEESVILPAYIL